MKISIDQKILAVKGIMSQIEDDLEGTYLMCDMLAEIFNIGGKQLKKKFKEFYTMKPSITWDKWSWFSDDIHGNHGRLELLQHLLVKLNRKKNKYQDWYPDRKIGKRLFLVHNHHPENGRIFYYERDVKKIIRDIIKGKLGKKQRHGTIYHKTS